MESVEEERDSSGDTGGHAHEVVTLAVATGSDDPCSGGCCAGTVTVHTEGRPPGCSESLDVPATTLTASLLSLSLSLLDMMESILKALPVLGFTADVTSIILTMTMTMTMMISFYRFLGNCISSSCRSNLSQSLALLGNVNHDYHKRPKQNFSGSFLHQHHNVVSE